MKWRCWKPPTKEESRLIMLIHSGSRIIKSMTSCSSAMTHFESQRRTAKRAVTAIEGTKINETTLSKYTILMKSRINSNANFGLKPNNIKQLSFFGSLLGVRIVFMRDFGRRLGPSTATRPCHGVPSAAAERPDPADPVVNTCPGDGFTHGVVVPVTAVVVVDEPVPPMTAQVQGVWKSLDALPKLGHQSRLEKLKRFGFLQSWQDFVDNLMTNSLLVSFLWKCDLVTAQVAWVPEKGYVQFYIPSVKTQLKEFSEFALLHVWRDSFSLERKPLTAATSMSVHVFHSTTSTMR